MSSTDFVFPFSVFPSQASIQDQTLWFTQNSDAEKFKGFVSHLKRSEWERLQSIIAEILGMADRNVFSNLCRQHLRANDLGQVGQRKLDTAQKRKVAHGIFGGILNARSYAHPNSPAFNAYKKWVMAAIMQCTQFEASRMKDGERGRIATQENMESDDVNAQTSYQHQDSLPEADDLGETFPFTYLQATLGSYQLSPGHYAIHDSYISRDFAHLKTYILQTSPNDPLIPPVNGNYALFYLLPDNSGYKYMAEGRFGDIGLEFVRYDRDFYNCLATDKALAEHYEDNPLDNPEDWITSNKDIVWLTLHGG